MKIGSEYFLYKVRLLVSLTILLSAHTLQAKDVLRQDSIRVIAETSRLYNINSNTPNLFWENTKEVVEKYDSLTGNKYTIIWNKNFPDEMDNLVNQGFPINWIQIKNIRYNNRDYYLLQINKKSVVLEGICYTSKRVEDITYSFLIKLGEFSKIGLLGTSSIEISTFRGDKPCIFRDDMMDLIRIFAEPLDGYVDPLTNFSYTFRIEPLGNDILRLWFPFNSSMQIETRHIDAQCYIDVNAVSFNTWILPVKKGYMPDAEIRSRGFHCGNDFGYWEQTPQNFSFLLDYQEGIDTSWFLSKQKSRMQMKTESTSNSDVQVIMR